MKKKTQEIRKQMQCLLDISLNFKSNSMDIVQLTPISRTI